MKFTLLMCTLLVLFVFVISVGAYGYTEQTLEEDYDDYEGVNALAWNHNDEQGYYGEEYEDQQPLEYDQTLVLKRLNYQTILGLLEKELKSVNKKLKPLKEDFKSEKESYRNYYFKMKSYENSISSYKRKIKNEELNEEKFKEIKKAKADVKELSKKVVKSNELLDFLNENIQQKTPMLDYWKQFKINAMAQENQIDYRVFRRFFDNLCGQEHFKTYCEENRENINIVSRNEGGDIGSSTRNRGRDLDHVRRFRGKNIKATLFDNLEETIDEIIDRWQREVDGVTKSRDATENRIKDQSQQLETAQTIVDSFGSLVNHKCVESPSGRGCPTALISTYEKKIDNLEDDLNTVKNNRIEAKNNYKSIEKDMEPLEEQVDKLKSEIRRIKKKL